MKRLKADEVHIWRVTVREENEAIHSCMDLLSPEEISRARKFVYLRDSARFVSCRAALRTAISSYLEKDPKQIMLEYGEWGKPAIAGEARLKFNVSHSFTYGVMAFALGRNVGIDLERLRFLPSSREIAERSFSGKESAGLRNNPGMSGFFRCWTRKEAFVKATGKGLSIPLNSFSVSVDPKDPPSLLEVTWSPDEVNRWQILDLPETTSRPGKEYVGAVAAEGIDWRLVDRGEFDKGLMMER